MTTPLYYIRLNYIKNHPITRDKIISYRGLYNLIYFSVRKLYWHVLICFILNIDHYILFAAKICISLLILHGINLQGYPHFSAILRYCIPGGIPLRIALLGTGRFF